MKRLKDKPTRGLDQIPSFLIKDCAHVLCSIFNLAIETSTFPLKWNEASVCSVLKTGDLASIVNYRPITLLNNFAKVFEASVYSRIYYPLKHISSLYQHGFMLGRSTSSNFVCFTQTRLMIRDKLV